MSRRRGGRVRQRSQADVTPETLRPRDQAPQVVSKPAAKAASPSAQHSPSHRRQLTHYDISLGAFVPHLEWRESRTKEYPSAIFPKVEIHPNNADRGERMLQHITTFTTDNKHAGVIMSGKDLGYIDYNTIEVPNASVAAGLSQETVARYVMTLITATWYTGSIAARRVIQELSGGLHLANQGAYVGEPNLPAMYGRKLVESGSNRQLYAYDTRVGDKTPFLNIAYRDRSITSFLGFLASNASDARALTGTGHEWNTAAVSGIDLSLVSTRNSGTEDFIGNTIARALLLPDLLSETSPMVYHQDCPSDCPH